MKHTSLGTFLLLAAAALALLQCQSPNDDDKSNSEKRVTLTGNVINRESGAPLENAVVELRQIDPAQTALSGALGNFSFEFEVAENREVRIIAFKEGFRSDTTTALAVPGRVVQVPLLRLAPSAATATNSGNAKSIFLYSQSSVGIGIVSAGDPEFAQLVFQAVDSLGRPVDLQHAAQVHFRILSGPGGGEYISPDSALTNGNGRVEAFLFSGFKAGVVQVQARIVKAGVESNPISIAIHGGYPDLGHFSVGPDKLNIPGLLFINLEDQITALVGDKFSNPARPGTAVYFKTGGGVIGAAAQTDENGLASVILRSGLPHPVHPVLGPGFAAVKAQTLNENQDTISVATVVLFSGYPVISVNPSSGFQIPAGESKIFYYTVRDQNNNPLAQGNSISVQVEGEGTKASGDLGVTLPDTQSPSWTSFLFTVEDISDSTYVRPVTVKIKNTGPNGDAFVTITGSIGH